MILRHTGAETYRLTPAYHPTAGVEMVYAGDGRLLVWCHRCHGDVAILAVGSAPRSAGRRRAGDDPRGRLCHILDPQPRGVQVSL